MWLMTTTGFYSVVRKPGDADLTVRARVCADLDALREHWLPELGPTQQHAGTDYPCRARVSAQAFSEAVRKLALAIDYPNFKDEVGRVQGKPRAHAYSRDWSALLELERDR